MNPATFEITIPKTVNPWVGFLESVTVIFDRYALFFMPDPLEYQKHIALLMELAASIREYAILSHEDLSEIWDKLRNNQILIDLIVAVTGDIFLDGTFKFDDVVEKLALSITMCNGNSNYGTFNPNASSSQRSYQECASDEVFRSSILSVSDYKRLLTANPWFITLCLLRRSGRLNVVRNKTAIALKAGTEDA